MLHKRHIVLCKSSNRYIYIYNISVTSTILSFVYFQARVRMDNAAREFFELFTQLLSCCVCSKPFKDGSGRMLSCRHFLCISCIETLETMHQEKVDNIYRRMRADGATYREIDRHLWRNEIVPPACPECRNRRGTDRQFEATHLPSQMQHMIAAFRVPCRNGCGRLVRLNDEGAHAINCPKTEIRCPMCRFPLLRRDLPAHLGHCAMDEVRRLRALNHRLQDRLDGLPSVKTEPTANLSDISD